MRQRPLPAHNRCPSPEEKQPQKCFSADPRRGNLFNFPRESGKSRLKEERTSLKKPKDYSQARSRWSLGRGRHKPTGTCDDMHCTPAEWPQGAHLGWCFSSQQPWQSLLCIGLGVPQQAWALPRGCNILFCNPLSKLQSVLKRHFFCLP